MISKRFPSIVLSLGLVLAQMPKPLQASCSMAVAPKMACCSTKAAAMPCCKIKKADPAPNLIAVSSIQPDRAEVVVALLSTESGLQRQQVEHIRIADHAPPPLLVSQPHSSRAPPAYLA